MKIALLNLPLDNNYGGNLQRYALCCILGRLGFTVEHIQLRFNYRLPWYKMPYSYTKRIIKKLFINKEQMILLEKKQRQKYFESLKAILPFYEKYVPHTIPIYSLSSLKKIATKYDGFIVGSDQVWRKSIAGKYLSTMFLDFVPANKPRFAYAVSLGSKDGELTPNEAKTYHYMYTLFSSVSVREQSAIRTLSQLSWTTPKACHLLDPTFLLTKEEYTSLLPNDLPNTKKYMLCYILDETEEKNRTIVQFSQKQKLSPLFLNLKECVSIERWIKAFNEADFIITDSYHGMVFSIIFNKPYYVFENKFRGNERFRSLTQTFNLTMYEEHPNWERINMVIEQKREESMDFLLNIKQLCKDNLKLKG